MRKIVSLGFMTLVLLAACNGKGTDLLGGGGTNPPGGGGSTIPTSGDNVAQIVVDGGPAGTSGTFNIPYVSVKVCAPGSTTNCQTIDHIEVDTGSYGLRIISTVLSSTVLAGLTQETDGISHNPIVECTQFGDGYSWGSVRLADVNISKETAANLPIQVIGDPGFPTVAKACSDAGGSAENTVATFGANGIIGVGPFVEDCGQICTTDTNHNQYFICPAGGTTCSSTALPLAQQVANPVNSFATDNNGTIVELPTVADAGAATVTGALIFGIGTQSNNGLGSAVVLTLDNNPLDQTYGELPITYNGTIFADGFIDSGSNLNFFNDNNIPLCKTGTDGAGFFCPNSELNLTASLAGLSGAVATVKFNIGNANNLFNANPSFHAFNNVGQPNTFDSSGFDLGLPFFFGRNVFTAIAGRNTSGGMGPYFAY